MKMEQQEDIFSKGIGNKEGMKSLSAKPVVVQGRAVEPVYPKGTKEEDKPKAKVVGQKLVLICKHPDREEPVKIGSIVFIAGKTIKTSAMWINLDEDKNIQKGSAIATLLQKYAAANIDALIGKTLDTELDETKYLAIKAY